jgi:hypothetical protein
MAVPHLYVEEALDCSVTCARNTRREKKVRVEEKRSFLLKKEQLTPVPVRSYLLRYFYGKLVD